MTKSRLLIRKTLRIKSIEKQRYLPMCTLSKLKLEKNNVSLDCC
jgi:hypothetical protein